MFNITYNIIYSIHAIYLLLELRALKSPGDGGTIKRIKRFSHHHPRAAVLGHYVLYINCIRPLSHQPLAIKIVFCFSFIPLGCSMQN